MKFSDIRRLKSIFSYPDTTGIEGTLAEFKSYLTTSLADEYPDTYKGEDKLRVSGFPYCGLRHLYTRLTATDNPVVGFGAKFYTGVGTVTHEVLQAWLGYRGRMFGNWKCTNIRCNGKRIFSNNSSCPKCGSVMMYHELLVKFKRHVSGHLDGVFRNSKGEYFVIDYKTSSVRVLLSNRKTKVLPYNHNVAQIKAYCALAEEIYEVKISGWILVYMARDSPQRFHLPVGEYISEKEKEKLKKEISTYDSHYDTVMNLHRIQEAKRLIFEKPCTSAKIYQEKFKGYIDCPLAVGGVCFNPQILKEKLLEAWREKPLNWQSRRRPKYLRKL